MRGSCEIFLLTIARFPGVHQPLSEGEEVQDYFDALLPLLIFLRHCFPEWCWQGARPTARLIIDDPLLVERYGLLDYSALRGSMQSASYATSIAFIPWNYWRTSRKAARAFQADPSLTICVHGCDHTNREFADVDPRSLQWKADAALRRMECHEHRTGLPFEPIMVFPQGQFSTSALAALRIGGYLAAVNTTAVPTDGGEQPITIGDLLRPAITKYHGFPVFLRRYPRNLIEFAFDAFIGRPMLIVQHHDDFRDGFHHLEALANEMRTLDPKLEWGPLSDQLMDSCMIRLPSESTLDVHFFTRRFRFTNPKAHRAIVTFSKDEPASSQVKGVLVDGASAPFSIERGRLVFEHPVEAHQRIEIEIADVRKPDGKASRGPGLVHAAGVVARRALSEFRDNKLAKHPPLLIKAREVARRMKLTGSRGG